MATRLNKGVAILRRPLRVLIVGDERKSINSLVRLVRLSGHAARVARGGFIELAAARRADVVLLDMDSVRDGCQLAGCLPPGKHLTIAVMAPADDERRQDCIAAGIDVLLMKPVDPEVLETLLFLESEHTNRRRELTAGAELYA